MERLDDGYLNRWHNFLCLPKPAELFQQGQLAHWFWWKNFHTALPSMARTSTFLPMKSHQHPEVPGTPCNSPNLSSIFGHVHTKAIDSLEVWTYWFIMRMNQEPCQSLYIHYAQCLKNFSSWGCQLFSGKGYTGQLFLPKSIPSTIAQFFPYGILLLGWGLTNIPPVSVFPPHHHLWCVWSTG